VGGWVWVRRRVPLPISRSLNCSVDIKDSAASTRIPYTAPVKSRSRSRVQSNCEVLMRWFWPWLSDWHGVCPGLLIFAFFTFGFFFCRFEEAALAGPTRNARARQHTPSCLALWLVGGGPSPIHPACDTSLHLRTHTPSRSCGVPSCVGVFSLIGVAITPSSWLAAEQGVFQAGVNTKSKQVVMQCRRHLHVPASVEILSFAHSHPPRRKRMPGTAIKSLRDGLELIIKLFRGSSEASIAKNKSNSPTNAKPNPPRETLTSYFLNSAARYWDKPTRDQDTRVPSPTSRSAA